MELPELAKRYLEIEAKHSLPKFEQMVEVFEIDKIDRDSPFFLRLVRKQIMEKLVNSMNFLEMLLNPVNAPRMYYSYLKSVSLEDKERINKIYGKLADLSLLSLSLEIDYDEQKEADLIKHSFKVWNELRPEFRKILENMIKPDNSVRKEKSYFG